MVTPTDVRSPLLTYAEAAGFLRVSRRSVARLVEEGELPTVRILGRVLFDQRALTQFVARCAR